MPPAPHTSTSSLMQHQRPRTTNALEPTNTQPSDMGDASAFLGIDAQGRPCLKTSPQCVQGAMAPAPRPRNNTYNWMRYAMYFWMGRLAIGCVLSAIPEIMGMFVELADPLEATKEAVLSNEKLIEIDWVDVVKTDFKIFEAVRSHKEPSLFRNVPVIGNATALMLLRGLVQTHDFPVKLQPAASFRHFAMDRYWSPDLVAHRPYRFVPMSALLSDAHLASVGADYEFIRGLRPALATAPSDGTAQFVYGSFPGLLPYLEGFAPALRPLQAQAEQAQLWLSSPGVRADWHYDNMDNVLLQLHGTKTVLFVGLDACPELQAWPSLHPNYRQGSLPRGTCGGVVRSADLRAGDMLYLPAGVWHAVTTGAHSLSINLWLRSAQTQLAQRLRTVALPLHGTTTSSQRLARLGAMFAQFCKLMGQDRHCVAHRMARRVAQALQDGQAAVSVRATAAPICDEWDVRIAETSAHSKRAGRELHGLVRQHLLLSREGVGLAMVAVTDFAEEVIASAYALRTRDEDDDEDGGGGEEGAEKGHGRDEQADVEVRLSVSDLAVAEHQCFFFMPQ